MDCGLPIASMACLIYSRENTFMLRRWVGVTMDLSTSHR